ncbi:MAG TPA: 3-aminobutyryl-CoA ammonia lyase, partial [Thermoanaerobaculia bacterium]
LAPVHAGDFLEIEAEIAQIGRTSRQMRFEARRVIGSFGGSSARLLEPSEVVARATGTCVVPLEKQRGPEKA